MRNFFGIQSRDLLAAPALAAALSLLGCSSGSSGTTHPGAGGSTEPSDTGGSAPPASTAPGQGGISVGSGGATVSGTGGQTASPGTGGNPSTGGVLATGGIQPSGGVQTAGTVASGGKASGGVANGGTKATGGVVASGGLATSGGVVASGGVATSGGVLAGGSKASGGVAPTGGVLIGGATPSGGVVIGGSTTASGTPVLVSTFDISKVVGTPGMRLGDINGDGKMEIVMAEPMPQPGAYTPQQVVCITAFDLKGKQLWQYGTPGTSHGASSDIPIQVFDMDGDGKSEIFANMSSTEMTVLDGTTGTLLRKIPLPQDGANDSIAIANLRGKPWPQDLLLKTRYSQNWAIVGIDDTTTTPVTKAGTVLWHHQFLPSDSSGSDRGTGHFPLIYDWDHDGKDEVMAGYFFLESDGTQVWTTNTTSKPELTMHADCLATADVDGDPSNGYEIVVGGNVAAMFHWKDGSQIWEDSNTVEDQQMGIGEYRSDSPGLEVVLLDRIGPRTAQGHDANVLLSSTDKLLWKESRTDYGWITVTENMNNWLGDGSDLILSYHRGGQTPPTLYDGYDKVVAQFPHSGNLVDNVQHADICGDGKEEVIVYNESSVWIFANGGCDLDAPPTHPSIPQQYHIYNFSEYSGWITPDVKFFTPGSKQ